MHHVLCRTLKSELSFPWWIQKSANYIMIIGISQMHQSCAEFRVWHVDMLDYFLQCTLFTVYSVHCSLFKVYTVNCSLFTVYCSSIVEFLNWFRSLPLTRENTCVRSPENRFTQYMYCTKCTDVCGLVQKPDSLVGRYPPY